MLNLTFEEYLDLTPKEFHYYAQAFLEKKKEETDLVLMNAWLTAAWQRVKKMPEFHDIVKGAKQENKTEINYQKIKRIAKQKGLKIPKILLREEEQNG